MANRGGAIRRMPEFRFASSNEHGDSIPDEQRIVLFVLSSEPEPADPIHSHWTIALWCGA